MSILAIIMIYIGINIDTFIALLFVMRRYNLFAPMVGLTSAELILWLAGVGLGKTLTTVFPDWITGFMGFVLLYLALRSDDQEEIKEKKAGTLAIFLLCLSLGGDNLAVLIPLAGTMKLSTILLVTLVFAICSLVTVLIVKWVAKFKPVAVLLEKYGSYCTKLVYLFAGIYIILSSKVIQHLFALL